MRETFGGERNNKLLVKEKDGEMGCGVCTSQFILQTGEKTGNPETLYVSSGNAESEI